ncbi:MAG: hypothetical protein CO158_07940 [Piscirickettsiaceae bacterium CG_4_9_14_3_um_filter_43_564]|nr:hypothetical protein [Thiomicrospira sp.]OIP93767.1 MAG: hypothetical protein AUK56_10920 [Thiomicrospira sp. CG2_30_44_34]PIQ06399.1 MAG: hypothetical protein COW74_00440 [Piscirickettsiaceae bacterium CG18_big_fil_WC_8_21_14_2_50_44_103]PIU37858.1 MAG: hypothetical protein COT01_09795 [Piscirickettsiaceae bacterium CG07_land_8_20_14_0_80_44_28]PIW77918.1 MAG: hypothetical protein CO000_04265 [Piscirickettsiaceae bacterium CG_4_8_14_3_um_filter_44_38]PIX80768.1 MAG: hypothetical protein CO
MQLTKQQLKEIAVFGIAGNFAEHLNQAGEDADFLKIKTQEANAPKGIFPIYIPGHPSFLGTFPLSDQQLQADFSHPINVQMEPELCVLFKVEYEENHAIRQLTPQAFAAFNDCSIRRPNATKISQKKNWGVNSTGISSHWISLDQFDTGGHLDAFQIACYLKRGDHIKPYGIDSPVVNYSYFYQPLQQWLIETFNNQTDFGPLEDLRHLLSTANYPKQLIISLGATRYTPYGETTFLKPDDQLGIFVYNSEQLTPQDLINQLESPSRDLADNTISSLIQTVSDVNKNTKN